MASNNNGSSSQSSTVVGNSELFWEKLCDVLGKTKEELGIPMVCGRRLNLHQLFIEVTVRGGCDKVTDDRRWKQVANSLNYPPTFTSGSYVLRKNYLMFLYQMEQEFYVPKPNGELRNYDNEEQKPQEVQLACINKPLPVGSIVKGVFEGWFNGKYVVTAKLGSEEWKGAFYPSFETPNLPQQTTEPLPPPPGFPARLPAPKVPPTHATRQAPSTSPGPRPSVRQVPRGLRQSILAARARTPSLAPAPGPMARHADPAPSCLLSPSSGISSPSTSSSYGNITY